MRVPLLGGAYQAKSIIANAQSCINLYPEVNPQPDSAPVPVIHYLTPGLRLLRAGPGDVPVRCTYRASNGDFYAVIGDTCYYVDSSWTATSLGTVTNLTTPIVMADNGIVIVLVDGTANGWVIDMAAHTFGTIDPTNFYGATRVDFVDTYLLFNRPGTSQWYISFSNADYTMFTTGVAFDPLDIAAKTGYPDFIAGLMVMHREVWLIGTLTTEIWYNSGAADFTFQPQPGAFVEHGCIAPYSIAAQDLNIYWLSQDKQGRIIVIRGSSYQAHRISTHAIENEFATYGDVSDAIGFTYQQEGHTFYFLTFPTADKTWCYDEATEQWHERVWTDDNGFFHRHRANCGANVYNTNVVGDWGNGNLYALDLDVYTDNGDPISRVRSFPHLIKDAKRIVYRQFIADMAVGEDLNSGVPFQQLRGDQLLESTLEAICLIPGAGEFVYATEIVTNTTGGGSTEINHNTSYDKADVLVSLDELETRFPNLRRVTVVLGWFGLDLRVGQCDIMPGVENLTTTTSPISWRSGGINRAQAHLISQSNGGPAYGGTPSEQTIIQLITELKSRGYEVGLYPFIFMDIPAGNSLPNPYGGTGQPVYPWRGRITCDPAPGQMGTVDKTSAAATQVAAFFGSAAPTDWSVINNQIVYSGPNEWSLRKFIFYCATLAEMAGGVDLFVMGSELIGMTQVRSSATAFPSANRLITMAADCRTILSSTTELTYSADWSEYFGYHPSDGSNDVFFHLDPVWADNNISHVGIDFYPPLADWRDNPNQLDEVAGYTGPYQVAYIDSNVAGGEDFDWYYANMTARNNQTRTPITDGSYNKPWVFRAKDLVSWWSNLHYNRPSGVQSGTPTAWVPESKPIRFTEFGCPAINKGSNEPNLFVDAKSSESGIPYYSNGSRDDLNQRIALETVLVHFRDVVNSPISTVYNAPMIAADGMSAWCWDARPFPQFPSLTSLWSDAPNYARGHWLEGRSTVNEIVIPYYQQISLRWSDTRGASWSNRIEQSLGAAGEYYTSIQWQRLGIARDRVFELSWSAPCNTALNGAWVDSVEAAT